MTVMEARTDRAVIGDRNERAIYLGYVGLAFCSIFLQKFGLRFGESSLAFNSVAMWGVLAWLIATGRAKFVIARLLLFSTLLVAMMISVMINGQTPNLPALGLICLMYAAFSVRIDLSENLARSCIVVFQKMMIFIVWIVIAQQFIQYTVGNNYWINLDKIFPESILVPGYAYIRPLSWNSPYNTPNGIFFLEPSFLSYCLALSLAFELTVFHNVKRMVLFGIGLLACMAATGLIALICTSPFWIMKTHKRIRFLILAAALPCAGLAFASGSLEHVLSRTSELGAEGSSGYLRVIMPVKITLDYIIHAEYMFTGLGPGTAPEGNNLVMWPLSKLLIEYGLATAIIFHAYLLLSLFGRSLSPIVVIAALIPYLFLGAGPSAICTILALVIFGSLLNVTENSKPKPAGARLGAAPRPDVSSWGAAAAPAAQQ